MILHPIIRAKKRYNLDLTELDLFMICILVQQGLAKEIILQGNQENAQCFHLRYGHKLIAPIIKDLKTNPRISTFLPTGKKKSYKKYCESKISESYKQMIKRMRIEK